MSKASFQMIEDLVHSINTAQQATVEPMKDDEDVLRLNAYYLATRAGTPDGARVALADVIAAAYSLGIRHATERYTTEVGK